MPKIYRISRSGLRLFYKIRHHRGHGIHSPFVFNLITKVVEEKKPYYAYDEIRNYLSTHPEVKNRVSKSNLLSFRLTNYFGSKNILELGSGYGINTLFLTAPSSNIKCQCFESSQKKREISELLYKDWDRNIILLPKEMFQVPDKQDCVCVDLKRYFIDLEDIRGDLFGILHDKSFMIIKGIRTNKRHQLLWKNLINEDRVRVSLDLFHEGILFFDPKLYKKNYKISF